MKDASPAIHMEPIFGPKYTQHRITVSTSKRIAELIWDPVENKLFELYYDIQEITIEQVEHEKDHKR
jgi:hypothetical protein